MLLEEALQEYVFDCQLRKLSERTIKSVKNNNKRLFCYLGNNYGLFELEKVKRIHIQAFVNHLSESGHKETYVNSLIKSYRGFFKYCETEEYINLDGKAISNNYVGLLNILQGSDEE